LTNQRDDDQGGDLDARLRWPLEVLAAVRAAWDHERPLAARLNVDDRRPGGLTIADGVTVARVLHEHGVDLVDVVAGHTIPDGTAAPDYRRGFLVEHASTVRNEVGVVTATSGGITTLDEVNTVLGAGRADLVAMDPAGYGDPRPRTARGGERTRTAWT
jgi:anthraniloyl-CoA monooxygenase